MTPLATEQLIIQGLAVFGYSILAIIGATLTISVAYLVFRVGWRKTKGSLSVMESQRDSFDRAAGYK